MWDTLNDDILVPILSEWLGEASLVHLDSALTNHASRKRFIATLQLNQFVQKNKLKLDTCDDLSIECIKWFINRKVKYVWFELTGLKKHVKLLSSYIDIVQDCLEVISLDAVSRALVPVVAKELKKCSKLQQVLLKNNEWSDKDVASVVASIPNKDLVFNVVMEKLLTSSTSLTTLGESFPNVQSLHIRGDLTKAIKPGRPAFTKLEELSLLNVSPSEQCAVYLFQHSSKLRELFFASGNVDIVVSFASQFCRRLTKLSLQSNQEAADMDENHVADMLALFRNNPQLEDVVLSDFVSSAMLIDLCAACPGLRKTHLAWRTSFPRMTELASAMRHLTRLQRFELSIASSFDVSSELVVESLATHCPCLEEFVMTTGPDLPEKAAVALVRKCIALKSFQVGPSKLLGDELLCAAADSLPNLTTLGLAKSEGMTDESVICLLAMCSRLETLMLPMARLVTDETALVITEQSRSLRQVSLCVDRLTEGALRLLVANPCGLSALNLTHSPALSGESIAPFQLIVDEALAANHRFDLSGIRLPPYSN